MRLLSLMGRRIHLIGLIPILLLSTNGCTELTKTVTGPTGKSLTYVRDIQPILDDRCVRCHGGDVAQRGLNLSTYESAVDSNLIIIPGDPTSRIISKTSLRGSMRKYLDSPGEAEMIHNWVVVDSAAKE
ncbi:MAG: c-type cytochrome domain-containing protein [Fidelibacterota bacterium]